MKIQGLAVLFIIIILPISVVLSVYTNYQVQTLSLQTSYDAKLNNATYDALKAFQLNTINSSTSDLANSKIRDIEASVNTFYDSIATNFNMAGYNEDVLKEYIPALVYTMYDGFYIYSNFTNTLPEEDKNKGGTEYPDNEKVAGLKPYIHYSMRYKSGTNLDVVITYSLDNYITVQGTDKSGEPINISGYLLEDTNIDIVEGEYVLYRNVEIYPEYLQEYIGDNNNSTNYCNYIKINGVKYYNENNKWYSLLNGKKIGALDDINYIRDNYSAYLYYAEAKVFGEELRDRGISSLKTSDIYIEGKTSEEIKRIFGERNIFATTNKSIEEPDSNFNQHRLAVIRYVIEKELSTAIANYNNYSGVSTNFQMPTLEEQEWDKLLNNISIISFLQGLNIGGKVYNGYSIINNTKNKEVVTENSIYISALGQYHNVKSQELLDLDKQSYSKGYLNIDYERTSIKDEETKVTKYFFPRKELASYSSIVTQTSVNDVDNIYEYLDNISQDDKGEKLAELYYTALGRERYSSFKINNNANEIVKKLKNLQ